jgi:hypothetical protein
VEDLVRRGEQTTLGNRLSTICRRKTLNARSSGSGLQETERRDLTGSSNSKSFSVKKITRTD